MVGHIFIEATKKKQLFCEIIDENKKRKGYFACPQKKDFQATIPNFFPIIACRKIKPFVALFYYF